MSERLLALLFSVAIVGQAWVVRRLVGTWLFPACLFGLFWFAFTFGPLGALFMVPVSPWGVGFLLLCALVFSATGLAFHWRPALLRNEAKPSSHYVYGTPFVRTVFLGAVLLALSMVMMTTLSQGITLHELVFNLFGTAEAFAELRYTDQVARPLIERWSVVFAYVGVMLGGLRYSSVPTRGRRAWMVFLSFLPSVLIAVTQSAKWPLLLSIVLFYSGVLVGRIFDGTLHLLGRGNRKSVALYGGIALVILSISFLTRLYDANETVRHYLAFRFASYTSGHLFAFSDWFAWATGHRSQLTYVREQPGGGYYTFGTLMKMLGSRRELPVGLYNDEYAYADVLLTNVFTMFRGLIMDFGVAGSLAFMAAIGLLFHGAFYALLSIERPVLSVVAFLFMMGFLCSSFVASLFGSNITYYIAFGLVGTALSINALLLAPPHWVRRPVIA